jgi:pimeloyl-ACP methyl ester carboxylesterase
MDPDIRYAKSGGISIAYQVVGDGATDLIYIPDYMSNLVYGWESPHWRGFYDRLAESFRLILFDKRGTGLSDFGGQFPSIETRMDDVRAVLDAVGSSSAVLLGSHDGCSMAALYAATYPERTRAIALFHRSRTFPRARQKRFAPGSPSSASGGEPRSTATRCSAGTLQACTRARRNDSGSRTGSASARVPWSHTA